MLGILLATLLNHGLAGAVGAWILRTIGSDTLRWVLGLSFLAMAAWSLVPDRLDASDARPPPRLGVFGATLVAFFFVEIGDKTQVATIALAAKYASFTSVVAGTTLGMMIANVPAVLLGERFAHRLPVRLMNGIAALLFAVLGVLAIAGRATLFD